MKKLLQSLFVLLFVAFNAIAQDRTINGTVTSSEDGLPLPGASVKIKEIAGPGTLTGNDGRYSIRVNQNAKTLVISSLGFVTREVSITGTTINLSLTTDTKSLDEVLIVGYGTAKKETFTGSTAQINSGEFANRPLTNVLSAVVGADNGGFVNFPNFM